MALIVDTVIDAWKNALSLHEEIELPIGKLRVVKRKTRRVFQIQVHKALMELQEFRV